MSTFRAQAIADRIVIVHDMPDAAIISELDVEQADLLLQQLEIAVRSAVRRFAVPPPAAGAAPDAIAAAVVPASAAANDRGAARRSG